MTGSAVQNRIAELRAQLVEKGTILPEKPATSEPAPATVDATQESPSEASGVPDSGTVPTQGADGRWRNPDGTFAPPPTADVATDGEPDADVSGGISPETDNSPEPIVVQLRGRNDTDAALEIEVSDPEVAERLRQNANEGMRRAEYNRQVKALEEERAELRELAVMLETAPESIVEGMSEERQDRVLRYLLASGFERHRQTIEQWWNDDVARRSSLLDMRDGLRTSREQGTRAAAAERKAAEVRLAVRELIPPNATDQDAKDFYNDSIHALTQIATERGDIDPAQVPELLKQRVQRYWGAQASATPAPAAPATLAVAKPVGSNAEQIAQRARATVARTQAAQAQRKVAAKVAPQGAGAVPVVTEKRPPKGLTIQGVVKWAKENGWGR